ncbi:PtsA Phosphoenolpyruvate-protein kinase (PTS system EI component in bacteria) [Candidatus Nanopelagicaceae bacterium]
MNFKGIGVSPGVVVGPIRRIVATEVSGPVPADIDQVLTALEGVAVDLDKSAEAIELEVAKEVLGAQAMMARDPSVIEVLESAISEGVAFDVRPIVEEAFGGFKEQLLALGGYFAERVSDIDEIQTRLINKLAGNESAGLALTEPTIVVAEDLTPSDTAALNLKFALALVCSHGGATSHTAIVARGLGIPAIVGCSGVMDLSDGTIVMVDGRIGDVIVDASSDEISTRSAKEAQLKARAESVTGPGRLSDGTPVQLLGNAGTVEDVRAAVKVGAEGIGLFRTELLFLDSQVEPSVEEQTKLYSEVFDVMAGKKVVIRTLDAGSDKPVPYINAVHEENPALGVRGWRLTRTSNDVLNRQLEALANASVGKDVKLWVMAPMINTPDEAKDFADRVRALGMKTPGVMIETPAAALHADCVLEEVEFGSFGTNDLTQYVMASDRMDSRLSDMTTAWHPAVLRAISIASQSAVKISKPVGVCGEAAANAYLAAVLVGLGVSSLSMAPSAVAEVRGFLASVDLEQCKAAALAAVSARSAEEAELLARRILEKN